ncbi:MAG TPA: ABC transporter permease [Geobacteraceae bacterium]
MSDRLETIKHLLLRWSGVAVFLLLWEIGPRLDWIDPYFVPPFSVVLQEIAKLYQDGFLGIHLVVSLWRALLGLATALAVALPLGFVLGRWLVGTAEALQPVLTVLSQVNPFSLLPVFVLFFGIGETAKVAVVGWVSLWPILFYTITATRSIDPIQVKTAASMGISREEMLLKVILPASLPTVFVGVRMGATLTFFILVAAEMLGASAGLGYLVHNSAMNYQIPRIYAGATFIVILGYLLNRGLVFLERFLFAWQEGAAFLPRILAEKAHTWRPGRLTTAAAGAALLVFLVAGGFAVQRVNREAADVSAEGGKHNRHFGQPVGGE